MDLKSEVPVTRGKITEIPFIDLVIKYVEKMEADNKITTLNFETKSGVLLNTND